MALPAIAAVRRAFDGRTIVLAALPSIAPLFEESTPAAPDEILAVDRAARAQPAAGGAGATPILLLPNSFGSAWRASRSGDRRALGLRGGRRAAGC